MDSDVQNYKYLGHSTPMTSLMVIGDEVFMAILPLLTLFGPYWKLAIITL